MIPGVFDKEGLMVTTEAGITLNTTSEVVDCSTAVEFLLSKMAPPEARERAQRMFQPLAKAASEGLLEIAQGENSEGGVELDVEISPVVGFTCPAAIIAGFALRTHAEAGCPKLLAPETALDLADKIEANLHASKQAGVYFN